MNNLPYHLQSIDLMALITADLGQPLQKSRRWAMWKCPFHPDQKTPSLGVNLQKGFWHCFGCNRSGNALTWLCEHKGMEKGEALAALGFSNPLTTTHSSGARKPQSVSKPPVEGTPITEPSAAWQKRGLAFLEYAWKQLWQTPEALAYLHESRRLADLTIQHFCLGYNPSDLWDIPERWGLSKEDAKRVWLPKGFVIPCFVERSLWYLKIRRTDGDPKYIHVTGGVPAMFGTESLRGAPLVLLTEGEFDCMLAWQMLRDVAGVASLGSASKKLDQSKWARYLLPAEEIVVVLDNDAAGKQGAQSLAGLSSQIHPVRIPSLRPNGKDVTDYVLAGGDLWAWLKHHLGQIENPKA